MKIQQHFVTVSFVAYIPNFEKENKRRLMKPHCSLCVLPNNFWGMYLLLGERVHRAVA
jgi:hypothetical protein